MSHAVERAGEAIASAGGAVIIAFMAMVLSSLSIFRSIGPALAIAVAMAVLAALTLVPAVVAVLGPRVISWPSKKWMVEPEATRFRAIGRSVAAHPVRYAVVSAGSLAVLSLFALGFNPTFNFSDSSTQQTESGQALITFQKGQPSGAADPTTVLLRSTDGQPLDDAELNAYATELGNARGRRVGGAGRPHRRRRGVHRRPLRRPRVRRGAGQRRGSGARHRALGRAGRDRVLRRRHHVDLRRPRRRDGARLLGRVPGRGSADHDHLGAAAAQPRRAVCTSCSRSASASPPAWARPCWSSKACWASRG